MFMTLYYTGMREGEMLALTPADVDLDMGKWYGLEANDRLFP